MSIFVYSVYPASNIDLALKVVANSAFEAAMAFVKFTDTRNGRVYVEVPKSRINNENEFKATKDCNCYVVMRFDVGIAQTLKGWERVLLFNPYTEWEKVDGSDITPQDTVVGCIS